MNIQSVLKCCLLSSASSTAYLSSRERGEVLLIGMWEEPGGYSDVWAGVGYLFFWAGGGCMEVVLFCLFVAVQTT